MAFNYGYCHVIRNHLIKNIIKIIMFIFSKTFKLCVFSCIFFVAISSAQTVMAYGVKRLGYAIQMGAFSDVKNAKRFTDALQKKGIDAFYFRRDNGMYAVRFGDFPTKNTARASAEKLVRDKLIDRFYIAPPNEIVFSDIQDQTRQKWSQQDAQSPGKDNSRTGTYKPQNTPRIERDMGYIAARTAERFVGIPYQWGGNNIVEGMDCSGFVQAVFNLCGVSVPRTSREQFKTGESVSRYALADGDLVFFGSSVGNINHVGIYVGDGKFVHAPRRGEDIKVSAMSDRYFDKNFVGARRYFP